MKHNKKRNTAFLYEALLREGTRGALEQDVEKIKLEIDNRTEKAIKQQESFNREYQRVDDDLKIPLSEKLKKSLGLGEEDENKKIERKNFPERIHGVFFNPTICLSFIQHHQGSSP